MVVIISVFEVILCYLELGMNLVSSQGELGISVFYVTTVIIIIECENLNYYAVLQDLICSQGELYGSMFCIMIKLEKYTICIIG